MDSEASADAGCVDDSGTAYIWGPTLRQSFGSASSEVDKPQPVPGIHHAVSLAIGGCHALVQEYSGAVASYGANEYGVLGHGSDSASKGMLPVKIPNVQFEQVRVLTLLPSCTYWDQASILRQPHASEPGPGREHQSASFWQSALCPLPARRNVVRQ